MRSRKPGTDVRFGICDLAGTHKASRVPRRSAAIPSRQLPRRSPSAKVVEPISVTELAGEPGRPTMDHPQVPRSRPSLSTPPPLRPRRRRLGPRPDARGWTFRFSALPARSGVLRCVRFDLPHDVNGVNLAVETHIEPVFEVAPAAPSRSAELLARHGRPPAGASSAAATTTGSPSSRAMPAGTAGPSPSRTPPPPAPAGTPLHALPGAQAARRDAASATPSPPGSPVPVVQRRHAPPAPAAPASTASPPASRFPRPATSSSPAPARSAPAAVSGASPRLGRPPVKTSLICLARTTGFHSLAPAATSARAGAASPPSRR